MQSLVSSGRGITAGGCRVADVQGELAPITLTAPRFVPGLPRLAATHKRVHDSARHATMSNLALMYR